MEEKGNQDIGVWMKGGTRKEEFEVAKLNEKNGRVKQSTAEY